MPNPVVSFEIRGPDAARLREFYTSVFGWQTFMFPSGYAAVETTSHDHDDATGTMTFTGEDAYMNDGVTIGSAYGQPAWKFAGEHDWRTFEPGAAGGGIAEGEPALMFYIQVPDLEAALERVTAAGGTVLLPPTEVAPNVTIANFGDPAGNRVGLTLAPARDA
jgi:predicted enzyme related to lactoylglutathione lyase